MNSLYSVFIAGDTIDLCPPMRDDIVQSGWFDWFNDLETTKYLDQGIYPNTPENQLKYLESVLEDPSRIVLLIRPKGSPQAIGVVSLSNINHRIRKGEIALVKGVSTEKHTLYALEAMARMTEHGFERVGLRCILGGQAWPHLKRWQQRLELLGYRCDGILRKSWAKGYHEYDVAFITCLLEDYIEIKRIRNGQFWPGEAKMRELLAALPETGYGTILESLIRKSQEEYFGRLKMI